MNEKSTGMIIRYCCLISVWPSSHLYTYVFKHITIHKVEYVLWYSYSVLVCFDCYDKNTSLVIYKQQKLIAHSSEGWKSKIWVPASIFGPLLALRHPIASSYGEGTRELCRITFRRPLIPFVKATLSWPNYLSLDLNTSPNLYFLIFPQTSAHQYHHLWGLEFPHVNLERTQIFKT